MQKKTRRISIKFQLLSSFVLVLILVSGLFGWVLYQFKDSIKDNDDLYNHTVNRTEMVHNARYGFNNALLNLRGYILYKDSNYKKLFLEQLNESIALSKEFDKTTQNPKTKAEAEILVKNLEQYQIVGNSVIQGLESNDPNLNQKLNEGRILVDKITQSYNNVIALQIDTQKKKRQAIDDDTKGDISISIIAMTIIYIIVISVIFWYSNNFSKRMTNLKKVVNDLAYLDLGTPNIYPTRNDEIGDMAITVIEAKQRLIDMGKKLHNSTETLTISSNQLTCMTEEQAKATEVISQSIQDITQGAIHSANDINDISAVMEQVSASVHGISNNANQINVSVQSASKDASNGMTLLNDVVEQTNKIDEAMKEIVSNISSMEDASDEIKNIVDLINGIAGQTNLLALNAAIEAARAGEHGRGFAVVADEVRKLAEQSSNATKNIEAIINNMSSQISTTVDKVSKANDEVVKGKQSTAQVNAGFSEIVNRLGQVSIDVGQVTVAIAEIVKGTESIVANIQNVSAVAEQTSASSQHVAASTEEQSASMQEVLANAQNLLTLAEQLKQLSSQFKI
jgi:methyl-accepting chemotaxis protein